MTAEFGPRPEVSPPKSEVLYALADIEGSLVGSSIVSAVLGLPTVKRVIIFGEPGANKSTVLGQLIREVTVLSGGKIAPTTVMFDEVIKSCVEEFGHHSGWDGQVWDEVSRRLQEKIETPSQDIYPSRREVKFIEVVAVHKKGAIRDRGAKVLKYFSNLALKEPVNAPETIFIAIVADPRSQEQTGKLREATFKTSDKDVVKMWEGRFGIIAEGLQGMLPENAGKVLKFLVSRMAKAVDILRTRTEMYEAAVDYLIGMEPEKRQRLLNSIRTPNSSRGMSHRQRREYLAKAIHMNYYVRDELQLRSGISFVVFSAYRKQLIHWPADIFINSF
ncbi:MAG: hypothetical protein A2782_02095 [Candidatus Blackburnbacteria bacterium RIFCSPHIGHO2_01_FULL_43_15b]|uniref:Uncharacterized protein n=1 Tax=Candidatus Blackburnbacteria bacterium RIFCSPHIGHO2_01_FULL_43_15b TaxID=1797513 RepID=A0A1G1UZ65_9BACT|nr:MAG: hypothetical protein A2782_02095 [Candidatus Blackburnbacteria bacterium RIFCSPHIGHO2_01_FULL_43_15b]